MMCGYANPMSSSCTDYQLVTPDPGVANNGGLPVFKKPDDSRYIYWDDGSSEWTLNSAFNGGSRWMYTGSVSTSYQTCPTQLEWDKWTSWTGSHEVGAALVCKPDYEAMCPCSSLTVAVGDETEIDGFNTVKNQFIGNWYRIADPGHSENAGRPVFANDRNSYYLYFSDSQKVWYYGTDPTGTGSQLSFNMGNNTHCPTQTNEGHGAWEGWWDGDWRTIPSMSITCAPPAPPSPPPSPVAPPPASYDEFCACDKYTLFCGEDIGAYSRCTDYTLILPDPEVARHDGKPAFKNSDDSHFLMWDKNNKYWAVRSSVSSTSFAYLQTDSLPTSGYECPDKVMRPLSLELGLCPWDSSLIPLSCRGFVTTGAV